MKIRFFREKDREQIENFFEEEDYWKFESFAAPGTDKLEVSQWDYIGVAEERGRLKGFIRFSIERNANYIGNVYVDKKFRRNGVCKGLFDLAEKRLKMGSSREFMYLFTFKKNLDKMPA